MGWNSVVLVPAHIFLLASNFFYDDLYLHITFYLSILFSCFIRIKEFLETLNMLHDNKAVAAPFIEKRLFNFTFFQISADIFGFAVFYYPLSFPILLLNSNEGKPLIFFWLLTCIQTHNGSFLVKLIVENEAQTKKGKKKSWDGFAGGVFLSVASGLFLSLYKDSNSRYVPSIPTKHFIFISLCISIVCKFGDFVEHFLKRAANLKQSNVIIPGSRGVLDRIDSVAFSAPLIYFYAKAFLNFESLNR